MAFQDSLEGLIRDCAATALAHGELPPDDDPRRLAFELGAVILAADAGFVLHDDPRVLDLAREVVERRLGVSA